MARGAGPSGSPAGNRRQARERALSLLYEAESKDQSPAAVLAGLPVPPADFAGELVAGVGAHLDELDKWITGYAKDWTIARMPALDRALLRLGVFELLYRPDVPTGAVISEAVELAQRFSTDESSRFVNGMLARIAESARPSEAEPMDPEAVGADPAEDDHPPAGEVVEDGLHQQR
ncbi:MAG: transcription antitermination factor NusB [Acidimicrobiales bacterium]